MVDPSLTPIIPYLCTRSQPTCGHFILVASNFYILLCPSTCPFSCTYVSLYERLSVRNESLVADRVADPDPVGSGVFAWIRIQFSNFSGSGSGSGSGFSPDSGTKKNCREVSKSDLSEENLKFMTKDRQKMKKATISY